METSTIHPVKIHIPAILAHNTTAVDNHTSTVLDQPNTQLAKDAVKISRQFIILLEDYRYLLACYQETCACHTNFDHQIFFRKLEEKYNVLSNVCAGNSLLASCLEEQNNENDNEIFESLRESNIEPPQKKMYISRVKISERPRIQEEIISQKECEKTNDDNAKQDQWFNKGEKVAYRCTFSKCEYLSFNQEDIFYHMKGHSNLDTPKVTSDKKDVLYVCEQCGKEFSGQKWLDNHIENVHTYSKIFECGFQDCTYKSKFRCVIEDHKRRHLKSKEFKCTWENCESDFVTRRDMMAHINFFHKGIKNYSCTWPNCEASFKDSNRLRHHYFTHTGERPYQCNYPGCEASFKQLPHLQKHQKMHSNSKITCEVENCGKKFRNENEQKKHMQTCHEDIGETYIKCIVEECFKCFKTKDELSDHLKDEHDMIIEEIS